MAWDSDWTVISGVASDFDIVASGVIEGAFSGRIEANGPGYGSFGASAIGLASGGGLTVGGIRCVSRFPQTNKRAMIFGALQNSFSGNELCMRATWVSDGTDFVMQKTTPGNGSTSGPGAGQFNGSNAVLPFTPGTGNRIAVQLDWSLIPETGHILARGWTSPTPVADPNTYDFGDLVLRIQRVWPTAPDMTNPVTLGFAAGHSGNGTTQCAIFDRIEMFRAIQAT